MKKFVISIMLLVIVMSCVLVSCGASEEDLVGTWVSDVFTSDSGYTAIFIIEFKEDGTYKKVKCKASGNTPIETETGSYEISGSEISCKKGKTTTTYTYEDNTLTSGKRTYTKE